MHKNNFKHTLFKQGVNMSRSGEDNISRSGEDNISRSGEDNISHSAEDNIRYRGEDVGLIQSSKTESLISFLRRNNSISRQSFK